MSLQGLSMNFDDLFCLLIILLLLLEIGSFSIAQTGLDLTM